MPDPPRRPRAGTTSRPGAPILFAAYAQAWGGAERRLPEVMAAYEGEPRVLLCPEGPLAERARADGVPVLVVPGRPLELRGGPGGALAAGRRLAGHAAEIRAAVAALRPRCVVAWGMRTAIACAVALPRSGPRPATVFNHVDFLPAPPAGAAVRWAAARADRVVVASRAVAADLDPDGRLGDRLAVAAPGVDVGSFTAQPPPPGPPTVLVLGALVAWKRPDLALEAVALAARALPDLRLDLAGHAVGPAGERLLAELRRRAGAPDLAGRVRFLGALPEPRAALAEATCLLHCADREPFGLVLLEAMAAGRPVVAPDAGGPSEILADGGGVLFAPGDAAGAARALVATVGDPHAAREAGRRARRRAEERFTLGAARERWRAAARPALATERPDPGAGSGLTLVAVSHNSARDLRRLLRSVRARLPAARVIVADAGSTDDSVAVARGRRDDVTVLELENVGYGRAANAGVALVQTAACAVVNADVELVDGSLGALAQEAVRDGAPERLLAPLVLRPDGRRQDSVHLAPVGPAAALGALVPPGALPGPVRRRLQPWRAEAPRRVAWAVGCCLVARTATLRRLGPFDERIFLYAEDLELGLRAGELGVETWWWPDARLLHHKAQSSLQAFGGEPFALLAAQRRAVVAERRGARAAALDDLLQLATFADRVVLKRLAGRTAGRERRQGAALRAVRAAAPRPGL